MVTEAEAKIDHYSVLGIHSSAGYDEIKKTYKSLALKWHPDKNLDNPHAHGMFQQVSAAYEILSDSGRRADYDRARQTYGYNKGGFSTSYGSKTSNFYNTGSASADRNGGGTSTWSSPRASSAYSSYKSYTSYGYSDSWGDSWGERNYPRKSKANYFQKQYHPKPSSKGKSNDTSTGNKPKTNNTNTNHNNNTKSTSESGQKGAKPTRPSSSNSSSRPASSQSARPSPAQQRNTKSYVHPIGLNDRPVRESDGRKHATSEEVPKQSRGQEQGEAPQKTDEAPPQHTSYETKTPNGRCQDVPNSYAFNFTSPITPENGNSNNTPKYEPTPFTVNGVRFSFGAFKEAMDASPSKKPAVNLKSFDRHGNRPAQGMPRKSPIPKPQNRPDVSSKERNEQREKSPINEGIDNKKPPDFNATAWAAVFSTGNPLMNGLANDPKKQTVESPFGSDGKKMFFGQQQSSPSPKKKNTQADPSKDKNGDHLKFEGFKSVPPLTQTFGDFNLKGMKTTMREEFLSGKESGNSGQSPTRKMPADDDEILDTSKSESAGAEDDKDEDEKEKELENKMRNEYYNQFSKQPPPSNNNPAKAPSSTSSAHPESYGGTSKVLDLHDSNIVLTIVPPVIPTLPDVGNLKTDAETLKNLERQILEYQALWNDYDAKVTQYHRERQAANLSHAIDILSDATNLSRYIDATYLDERVRREWASSLAAHRQVMSHFLTLRRRIDSLR